jgi:division protein CdvB (Snf7/Vps24/ESCRT-III family)
VSFFDKIKEGAKKGTELAQQTVELTKINSQISSKKKEIEDRYNKIGHIVYDSRLSNQTADSEVTIQLLCKEVAGLFDEINVLEQKIQEVKKERTCTCGTVVSTDVKFCPKCGANLHS